jgi:hypothetical protein
MEQVGDKILSKLVEVKSYRTKFFKNYCPISGSDITVLNDPFDIFSIEDSLPVIVDNVKFYEDNISLNEDDYVKNYANTDTQVHFDRKRIFIEESQDKIAIKSQNYSSDRRLGKRFFRIRKTTSYLTFNFKTKMFYVGFFTMKKKKVVGRTMRVNPTYEGLQSLRHNLEINEHIKYDSYFYEFFNKIWDRLGLQNPQNFYCGDYKQLYTLTTYLISGVKIPNNWLKFGGTFFSRKELRKVDMNLVGAMMNKLNLKGSKVKKIFNEIEWVDFDRVYYLYNILGVGRFNKLPEIIFDCDYTHDGQGKPRMINRSGGYWSSTYHLTQKEFLNNIPNLTNKEKDRIMGVAIYLDDYGFHLLTEHLAFKKKLLKLGEDVKLKFNTKEELVEEHEEFSRIIQSYSKGEIERFYGDVIDDLEKPIEYEGETYYPVVLRKTYDYEKESQHQRNCVRTYAERPDCIIMSIRKGSRDGDERITVEYQYRDHELINVQERAKFNGMSSQTFSNVAKTVMVTLNILYKTDKLKLPKMVKTFRNGKTVTQQSVFNEIDFGGDFSGGKVVRLVPMWDVNTFVLDNYYDYEYEELPTTRLENFENYLNNI